VRTIKLALTAVVTIFAMSRPALAQSSEDLAAAEELFRSAKALMQESQYERACPMFAESARLDRQAGTLLNLGVCYESQGKTASAFGAFSQAVIEATRKGQTDRAQFAKEHLQALEPKLSRVTITLQKPAHGENIEVDDRAIGEGSLRAALPMDPGEHAIVASAPGKIQAKQTFVGPVGPSTQDVLVTALEDAPLPPSAVAAPKEEPDDGHGRRNLGYVVGSVGIAGLATGAIFSAVYLSKARENNRTCVGDPPVSDGHVCTVQEIAAAQDTRSAAKVDSTGAVVGFAVGIVGLAAGTYLVLTAHPAAPKTAEKSVRIQITPAVGLDTRGLLLRGSF
jgi:hypothetical protein